MPRFAANLSFLFPEIGFLQRFAAARAAGFAAVEFHFPYEFAVQQVVDAAGSARVETVLFNLPAGDWVAGERGLACLPGRKAEFQDGVGRAIEYARALGTRQLNCLAGIPTPGLDPERAAETLVDNLRFAAACLGRAGMTLLLEPLNTRDTPGFLVSHTKHALALIDTAGAANLKLQYDIYHAQVMEGDLARTLAANQPRIGHIQLADNPGRHEPGTGEINFPFLFDHLDRIGYAGWVGCEYQPTTTTIAGLSWAAGYLEQQ